jgi:hypothetical protein
VQKVSRRADVTILTSDNSDFKTKSFIRNKDELFSTVKAFDSSKDKTNLI